MLASLAVLLATVPGDGDTPTGTFDASEGSTNGGADLPWQQSYKAGQKDENGALIGGSEIMHIKEHQGKLFAFNGYWQDGHYPKSQSCQVVRLDGPNANTRWTVDLDTGADGRSTHMKGNILESVHFTTDAKGRPVNTSLLVAASQADHSQTPAGGNALSVFVRDDAAATWSFTKLLPGPTGGRKVPRAIRVYHDDVTKVDRIFMLAGQPGIISGVFDSVKNQIVWDDAVEYPPTGNFSTRPLGLAEANGRLYFSVGGQIFVRVNGAKPDWTLAWSIPGNVNIEMDALIFVWTPAGRSPGPIFRLDGLDLTNHTETTLQALYSQHVKLFPKASSGGHATGSLGGYNRFLQVTLPGPMAETVHLVGFEQTVSGADPDLLWPNLTDVKQKFYAGGCYGVRWAPGEYTTGEVNGRYSPGKPVLEAARAFSHSPFVGEENVIYIGGFDANFHDATNKAWIFKAGLNTIVGTKPGTAARASWPTFVAPIA